jgi:hypothetical protein
MRLNQSAVSVLAALAATIILLCSLVLFGCGSGGGSASLTRNSDEASSQMSLESGVDKKVARSEGESASAGYDSQYREQARSTAAYPGETPAGSPAPAESIEGADASGMIAGILNKQGLAEQVSAWLIPQAYAADHGIDERYLIRDGACSLLVDNYQAAAKEVDRIAQTNGGMVSASNSERRGDDTFAGYITIRVPSDKFFATWNAVRAVGDLRDEWVTTEDASQEYVTQHSRLKNLIAEREVLEGMLADAQQIQRTRGLKEGYEYLLKTQERLFAVSGSIATTEDQLNALSDQIVHSTITVNMQEKASTLPKPAQAAQTVFRWDLGLTANEAYQRLLINVRGFLQGLIWFLITCWTWLIPLVLFIMAGRLIYLKWIKPTLPQKPSSSGSGSGGEG